MTWIPSVWTTASATSASSCGPARPVGRPDSIPRQDPKQVVDGVSSGQLAPTTDSGKDSHLPRSRVTMGAVSGNEAATRVHHVGMSVEHLDDALAFWEPFLGTTARWRTTLDRPYLGRHVGYPGVRIEAAFVDLPGGGVLELLEYLVDGRTRLP